MTTYGHYEVRHIPGAWFRKWGIVHVGSDGWESVVPVLPYYRYGSAKRMVRVLNEIVDGVSRHQAKDPYRKIHNPIVISDPTNKVVNFYDYLRRSS